MSDVTVGAQARMMSLAMRKLAGTLNRTQTMCLLTERLQRVRDAQASLTHPDERFMLDAPTPAYAPHRSLTADPNVNDVLSGLVDHDGRRWPVFFKPISGVKPAAAHAYGHDSPVDVGIHEVAAWWLARELGPPWSEMVASAVWFDPSGAIDIRASGPVILGMGGSALLPQPGVGFDQLIADAAFFDALIGTGPPRPEPSRGSLSATRTYRPRIRLRAVRRPAQLLRDGRLLSADALWRASLCAAPRVGARLQRRRAPCPHPECARGSDARAPRRRSGTARRRPAAERRPGTSATRPSRTYGRLARGLACRRLLVDDDSLLGYIGLSEGSTTMIKVSVFTNEICSDGELVDRLAPCLRCTGKNSPSLTVTRGSYRSAYRSTASTTVASSTSIPTARSGLVTYPPPIATAR